MRYVTTPSHAKSKIPHRNIGRFNRRREGLGYQIRGHAYPLSIIWSMPARCPLAYEACLLLPGSLQLSSPPNSPLCSPHLHNFSPFASISPTLTSPPHAMQPKSCGLTDAHHHLRALKKQKYQIQWQWPRIGGSDINFEHTRPGGCITNNNRRAAIHSEPNKRPDRSLYWSLLV